MEFIQTNISGVIEVKPNILKDDRGFFVKTFNENIFREQGIDATYFKEEYFSKSVKHALRGMHFQLPPDDHEKFVYCIHGSVRDVLFDMRKHSKTYAKSTSIVLNDIEKNCLYIPKGIAHGFYTLSDEAVMVYKTTTVYNPKKDSGIHWKTCATDFMADESALIISDRDSQFSAFELFDNPF